MLLMPGVMNIGHVLATVKTQIQIFLAEFWIFLTQLKISESSAIFNLDKISNFLKWNGYKIRWKMGFSQIQ